jgi:hypothetical protein
MRKRESQPFSCSSLFLQQPFRVKMESFYKNWLEKNKKENEEARQTLHNLNNTATTSNNTRPSTSVDSTFHAPTTSRATASRVTSNNNELQATRPSTTSSRATTSTDSRNAVAAPTTSRAAVATTSRAEAPITSRAAAPTTSRATTSTDSRNAVAEPIVPSTSSSENLPKNRRNQNLPINTNNDLQNQIIYQNNQLQLYLEKGNHIHQIRFRLQDHLFYMKIKLINPNADPPLLRDILDFLENAFDYVLQEIRTFYKPEDHNIAFLTLFQQPMISGLNTGKNYYIFSTPTKLSFNFLFTLREVGYQILSHIYISHILSHIYVFSF